MKNFTSILKFPIGKTFRFFLFLNFIINYSSAQVAWQSVYSGATATFNSICFSSTNNGHIVGSGGTYMKSTDGGISWSNIATGTTSDFYSVFFANDTLGIAVGATGTIMRTKDGGLNWTSITSGTILDLHSVYFYSAYNGFACGQSGIMLQTNDAGLTWTSIASATSQQLNSVYFSDSNNGIAVGNIGTIVKTQSGGSYWYPVTSSTSSNLNSIRFYDNNIGYTVGQNGIILKTYDGGYSWYSKYNNSSYNFNSISFTDTIVGYVMGDAGTMFKTNDYGNSWITISSPTVNTIYSTFFKDSLNGFTVGLNGEIFSTNTGGVVPCIPVVITTQPNNITTFTGQSADFSVTATGNGTINYQWQKDGNNIAYQNSSSLSIYYVNWGDTGNYRCIVWNDCGSDTSIYAKLTKTNCNPPLFNYLAEGMNACVGTKFQIVITAVGDSLITYQWQKNNFDIPGATSDTLSFNVVAMSDTGYYKCIATNACGYDISYDLYFYIDYNCYRPDTLLLTLSSYTGNIQWQESTDASTWNDVFGANNDTLIISYSINETGTKYYRAMEDNSGCIIYTNPYAHNIIQRLDQANIGDFYHGGILISKDALGQKGTIVAPYDQNTYAPYGCTQATQSASDTLDGYWNNYNILYYCTQRPIAASYCSDSPINSYYDWYLPALNEMRTIFNNQSIIPGLSDVYYWSSTESDSMKAYIVNPISGATDTVIKSQFNYVRAIRHASTNDSPGRYTAMLDLVQDPGITVQDVSTSINVCTGQNKFLYVVASGTDTLHYIWKLYGAQIPNSDNDTLFLNNINPSDAGSYECYIYNKCSAYLTYPEILVNVNPIINIGASSSLTVSCFGASDAYIVANATGGSGTINYLWSNGANSSTISFLTAGNYTLVATDTAGCSQTATYIIAQPDIVTAYFSQFQNVKCNNGTDGVITAAAIGGTSNYTYLWSTGSTSPTISNLNAGYYAVTVTDSLGCKGSLGDTIMEPAQLTPYFSTFQHISCNNAHDGIIVAAADGGTLPYHYLWSTSDTTTTINNLYSGYYSVTVTDANLCLNTLGDTIKKPAVLNVYFPSVNTPTCTGLLNGVITAAADGGTPLYNFVWSNSDSVPTAMNLGAGSYSVTVTDSHGCVGTNYVNLVDPPMLISNAGNNQTISYGSVANLSGNAFGGTPPYYFNWTPANLVTNANLQNTSTLVLSNTTSFTLLAGDNAGCTYSNQMTVIVTGSPMLVSASATPTQICLGSYSQLLANVSNGSGVYSYNWTSSPSGFTSSSAFISVNPAITTTYTLQVSDGVTTDSVNVIVSVFAPVVADAGLDQITCAGNSVTLSAMGGIQYLWNTSETTSTIIVSPIITETYIVTVTSVDNCTATDNVVISLYPDVNANFSTVNDGTGNGVTFNSSVSSIYKYYWEFEDGFASSQASVHHVFSQSGYYNVCLTVNDTSTGCQQYTCQTISVTPQSTNCDASFSYTTSNDTLNFIDNSTGNPTEWNWQFGDGYTDFTQNPQHVYSATGYYNVSLTTFNTNTQCMDTYELLVSVGNQTGCQAAFTYFNDIPNKTIYFLNQSHETSVMDYLWNFGDGNTSTDKDPVHTYTNNGYFSVCLSLTNCPDIICYDIKAGQDTIICDANFIYTVDTNNRIVRYEDRSMGNPNQWLWDFGDGNNATNQNETHQFANNGYFVSSLTTVNPQGCVSHFVDVIKVKADNSHLSAGFVYAKDTTSNKTGLYPFNFYGAIFGNPAKFTWYFGDGTTETTTISPTHTYTSKGIYNVELSVEDPIIGESDNYSRLLVIDTTVSIIENTFMPTLSVFPNPASNKVSIKLFMPEEENVTLTILDMYGAEVTIISQTLQAGNNRIYWDSNNFSDGIYTINLKSKSHQLTKKLVLTH